VDNLTAAMIDEARASLKKAKLDAQAAKLYLQRRYEREGHSAEMAQAMAAHDLPSDLWHLLGL